jgi:hypothetical protein
MSAINPFPPVSFNIMVKPVGSRNYLNCGYCQSNEGDCPAQKNASELN